MSAIESQLSATTASSNGAGELPTTSQNNAASYMTNDGITDMTIRKRTIGKMDDAMSDAMCTDDSNINETTSASSSTSGTSSTAYSFAGTALGTEQITTTTPLKTTNTETKTDSTKATTGEGAENEDKPQDDSFYECNICLDTAKDAVVSMCGHLFCWPCLHQWLETRPNRMLCPVCKAAISKDKVIPLYGRNSSKQEDPRNKVPPRPAGQRTEPEPQQGFQGFGFGDGFHMSFGIGAFPFAYFASSFNIEPRPAPANRGTTQYEDEQQLSKMFLYLAFLCIAWLMFA